ncbi:MAG: hypothetical protein ACFFCV_07395 [Promethearchaeota archaeon]
MNKKEKPPQEIIFRDLNELDLNDFYKALNEAISSNNMQTVYELSKVFTRHLFKKLNN